MEQTERRKLFLELAAVEVCEQERVTAPGEWTEKGKGGEFEPRASIRPQVQIKF